MTISASHKASNQKWDKDHMTTISVRVTIQKANLFKEACKQMGSNANATLLKTINDTIQLYEGQR